MYFAVYKISKTQGCYPVEHPNQQRRNENKWIAVEEGLVKETEISFTYFF